MALGAALAWILPDGNSWIPLLVLAPMRPVPHRSLRLLVKPISRFGHPPPCRAR